LFALSLRCRRVFSKQARRYDLAPVRTRDEIEKQAEDAIHKLVGGTRSFLVNTKAKFLSGDASTLN